MSKPLRPCTVALVVAALVVAGCGTTPNRPPPAESAASAGRPLAPTQVTPSSGAQPSPQIPTESSARRPEQDVPIPPTAEGAAPPPTARSGSGALWRAMAHGDVKIAANATCRRAGFDAQEQRYLVICESAGQTPPELRMIWRGALRAQRDEPSNYVLVSRTGQ